jgi:hypothetical protein
MQPGENGLHEGAIMDRHVTAAALLDTYARDWRSEQFHTGFYTLLDEARGEVPALVMGALGRPLHNAYFAGEAVSYLPPATVPAVVERALAALADAGTRATAKNVLAYVALEFPHLLHPHLTQLFGKGADREMYLGDEPWRGSGELHHPYLVRVLHEGGKDAHRALECLLETRTPAAFAALARNTKLLKHGSQTSYLLEVGYEPVPRDDDPAPEAPRSFGAAVRSLFARPPEPAPREWRRLYPQASYHLRFPDGYRDGLSISLSTRERHPTWHLDAGDAPPQRFGGEGECVCGICARRTQRLIVLDPVPPGLEVTAVPRLTLEMCARCVEVNEVMEYVHDAEGRPSPHRRQTPGDEPEFESFPLRTAEVRLAPTPARWFWQDWGTSNGRQNLSRLGGHPSWVQNADYPPCPECGRLMTFLIQLDAVLPAGRDESEEIFGEEVFYGFWCDRCRVSAFKWQNT